MRCSVVVTVLVGAMALLGSPAFASASQGVDYWTPERMASAVPDDTVPDQIVDEGSDTTIAPPSSPAGVQIRLTAVPRPYTDPAKRVHGKVFYTKGGRNTWCSSSVVTAPNKSLVWTAAHCVAGASNVAFVPAYNSGGNGDAPYGRWPARRVQTSANDHAVVVVGQVGGKYLQDVVGASGIRFDGPVGGRTTIWGYPAAGGWSGRDLTYCNDQTRLSGSVVYTSCATQGGNSGGGYITGASTPTGSGYLWANHTAGDGSSYAMGSVFGSVASQLYRANSTAPEPYIVGGATVTDPKPWITALHHNGGFTCTAEQIAPQWVLTAAHCVGSSAGYSVRIGSLNRSSGGTVVTVAQVIRHPGHNGTVHDMALLRLSQAVTNTYAPLAVTQDMKVRQQATIYGWGSEHPDWSGPLPQRLKYADGYVSSLSCISSTAPLVCTQTNGSVAGGDSGGPVFVRSAANNQYVLAGVCSAGRRPAGDGWAGYTSVAVHRSWIKQVAGV